MSDNPPYLSAPTVELVQQAMVVYNSIVKAIPVLDPQPFTTRKRLALASCDLAIEHFGGILLLLQTNQHAGSALALLRPVLEVRGRAFWSVLCASDEQCEAIWNREEEFPALATVAQDLVNALAEHGAGERFRLLKGYREILHGLTHGGAEQLRLRFDEEKGLLLPTYPNSLLEHLIRAVTVAATHVTVLFFDQIGLRGSEDPVVETFNRLFAKQMD